MLQVLRDCFKQLKVLDDKPESTEDGDEDEVDASKSYILTPYIIRPKKNYMFLRHRSRHIQAPASKLFITFLVFALKIACTSSFVSLIWPPVATILLFMVYLVDFWCTHWLLHIQKVRNFQNLLGYIIL